MHLKIRNVQNSSLIVSSEKNWQLLSRNSERSKVQVQRIVLIYLLRTEKLHFYFPEALPFNEDIVNIESEKSLYFAIYNHISNFQLIILEL